MSDTAASIAADSLPSVVSLSPAATDFIGALTSTPLLVAIDSQSAKALGLSDVHVASNLDDIDQPLGFLGGQAVMIKVV